MIRSGVDWIETYNYTQALAVQQGPVGIKFYWQHLMPNGSAFETTKGVAGAATELVVATGGFVPYDSIINNLGPLYTDVTAISNAAIPVVTAASATAANGLSAGSVVAGEEQKGDRDKRERRPRSAGRGAGIDDKPMGKPIGDELRGPAAFDKVAGPTCGPRRPQRAHGCGGGGGRA